MIILTISFGHKTILPFIVEDWPNMLRIMRDVWTQFDSIEWIRVQTTDHFNVIR